MNLYHNKIKFHVDAEFSDTATILKLFGERYPLIPYCGFYQVNNQVWLYVHHTKKLSAKQLYRRILQLRPETKIKEFYKYSTVLGRLLNESGPQPVPGRQGMSSSADNGAEGGSSLTNHATTAKRKTINLNPFGQESLEHITLAYTRTLLAQKLGWGVLCEFANEIYRLEENMNLRLRIKERYMKTRIADGVWWTSLKKSECEIILINILQKIRAIVNTFEKSIPEDHLRHFKNTLTDIEHARTCNQGTEERDDFEQFTKDGVNIIGENIYETVKRNKLKLV